MGNPKFFEKPTEPRTPSKTNASRVVKNLLFFLIVFFVLGYFAIKLFSFGQHIVSGWQEISFAYNKPNLVKNIREEYQKKEALVDREMLTGKPDQQTTDSIKSAVEQALQEQSKQSNSFR